MLTVSLTVKYYLRQFQKKTEHDVEKNIMTDVNYDKIPLSCSQVVDGWLARFERLWLPETHPHFLLPSSSYNVPIDKKQQREYKFNKIPPAPTLGYLWCQEVPQLLSTSFTATEQFYYFSVKGTKDRRVEYFFKSNFKNTCNKL